MTDTLKTNLNQLCLTWIAQNYEKEITEAARGNRPHYELLLRLTQGETEARLARAVQRRLRDARLPAVRTLDSFDWSWPAKLNADHVRHLFTLNFLEQKANVVFIGGVGLGKTHLAAALAREVCLRNRGVLFVAAVDIINTLAAAPQGLLHKALKRYTAPELLVIDELGYLPVDRAGAELLFQVLSGRYEHASTVITTNRPYKDWAKTFSNDATLASAVLDRILHHCETVVIEGRSYRMKNRIEED